MVWFGYLRGAHARVPGASTTVITTGVGANALVDARRPTPSGKVRKRAGRGATAGNAQVLESSTCQVVEVAPPSMMWKAVAPLAPHG
ncbi:hypothetical protein GCM10023317_54230 [Actinopolymorpha pittospori]|uniref:Uncharacterized protein n=1 Tax=Actinopolymorpha pittospori TaxID=648752 RepID=A0A927RQ15_9ACTN|nr:hypothetical protein [Actinopolymorpha pittospori]